jgi:uncharacterized protein HemY
LIRARLAETPDEPRLWCALGDLNLDDDAYREAWERSVRFARSCFSQARQSTHLACLVHGDGDKPGLETTYCMKAAASERGVDACLVLFLRKCSWLPSQGHRSARAQRSLAASAVRRKDYSAAVRTVYCHLVHNVQSAEHTQSERGVSEC